MVSVHHWLGTWETKVNAFVVSTEAYRQMFAAAGFPPDNIALKPHFVESDPGTTQQKGEYALFVGRLAREKGLPTLLAAWQNLPSVPLYIRGEGPLAELASVAQSRAGSRVSLVPRMSRSALLDLIKAARFLVWPSEGYYESFGLVAIEAFACGVPVIASRCEVMQEIVHDGHTGLHFTSGDSDDLAKTIAWAWTHPDQMREMGRNARAEYQAKYTAERNYQMLSNIYQSVLSATADESSSNLLPLKSHP